MSLAGSGVPGLDIPLDALWWEGNRSLDVADAVLTLRVLRRDVFEGDAVRAGGGDGRLRVAEVDAVAVPDEGLALAVCAGDALDVVGAEVRREAAVARLHDRRLDVGRGLTRRALRDHLVVVARRLRRRHFEDRDGCARGRLAFGH